MSDARLELILSEIVLPTGKTVGASIADDPWVVKSFLQPVFATNRKGLPKYTLVYLEMGRGSWKSGGLAACAVAECVLFPQTDVVICASDRDQAKIDLDALDGYLRANPRLGALFTSRDRGDTRHVEGGSRIRVISADVPGAWGLGGTHPRFRVYCEELSEWRDEALWGALASATGKARDSQVVIASNAGFDRDRSWQWKIRESARREKWGYLYAPRGPHASWISPAWVAQQRALLPPLIFDRVITNSWTSQSGDFITAEQWRRCVEPGLRPAGSGSAARHFGGLDLGLTRDRTAFAIVHVRGEEVVLDELLVFEGDRADPVEIAAVERAVFDAYRRYPRLEVLVDPWQAAGTVQKLKKAGRRIGTFTFSSRSIAGLSRVLYESVSDASLRVFEDVELEREVLGLMVRETADGWRFDHRGGGYSDRCVALAMALSAAVKTRRTHQPLRTSSAVASKSGRRRRRPSRHGLVLGGDGVYTSANTDPSTGMPSYTRAQIGQLEHKLLGRRRRRR